MASRYKSGAIDSISKNVMEGEQVEQRARELGENTADTVNTIDRLEVVDEDTQRAIDEGRAEARSIGEKLSNSEIYEPSQKLSAMLKEIGNKMGDDAEIEKGNARKAEQIGGDYGEVGGNIETKVMESSEEFQEISDDAMEEGDNIVDTAEDLMDFISELLS